jgi:hydrogenase nickel incorporation protein HypA/HybF
MHELSIAQSIVEIVEQHLPAGNGAGVRSVRLRIGDFAGVVPDSLEFCFSAVTAGTRLDGASLDIERVALVCKCQDCHRTFPVRESVFRCPTCSGGQVAIVTGRELQVTEIELFDEGERTP